MGEKACTERGESTQCRAPTSENEGLVGYDAVIAEENKKRRAELDNARAERDIPFKAARYFADEANG